MNERSEKTFKFILSAAFLRQDGSPSICCLFLLKLIQCQFVSIFTGEGEPFCITSIPVQLRRLCLPAGQGAWSAFHPAPLQGSQVLGSWTGLQALKVMLWNVATTKLRKDYFKLIDSLLKQQWQSQFSGAYTRCVEYGFCFPRLLLESAFFWVSFPFFVHYMEINTETMSQCINSAEINTSKIHR